MTTTKVDTPTVAFEGGLGAAYVSMSAEEAAELVRSEFEIDGQLTRLATEKDDTFRVDADASTYILKVANPSEDPREISLQNELLLHIATVEASIPVPRLIESAQKQLSFAVVDRAGQSRWVRMMSYLEGTPLDTAGSNARERFRVGQMLARLRYATAAFSHPADSRVLAWDIRHLAGLRHLLEHVTDRHQHERLTRGMERFCSLERRIAKLRTQVLHNDFSKSNIIVDRGKAEFVTGIIDFGDVVRTGIAIDVSTALGNQLPRKVAGLPGDDLFAEGRDILRGYLSVAELTDEELRLIPHLVMGRIVARALITLWRAKLFPENSTYIMRNTEQVWAQLDWLLARSIDELSSALL